jgi:hypothetical protein
MRLFLASWGTRFPRFRPHDFNGVFLAIFSILTPLNDAFYLLSQEITVNLGYFRIKIL